MSWYYANAGKQVGPITDSEFDQLRRDGVIGQGTLVWREGMEQWAPFETIASGLATTPNAIDQVPAPHPSPGSPGALLCTQCRKLVPADETMQFGNAIICSACKPIYIQKLREGAAVTPSQSERAIPRAIADVFNTPSQSIYAREQRREHPLWPTSQILLRPTNQLPREVWPTSSPTRSGYTAGTPARSC